MSKINSVSIMSKTNNSKSSSSSSVSSFKSSSNSSNASLQQDITKCTYCLNSLGNVSIKCNECTNFHLCLKCFSMSAEIGEHKKDHSYRLKSDECFPVFDSEDFWTYKEELLLIDLVEQFGLGNWDDISKNLTNRSSKECENHYYSYYVYGNLGKHTIIPNNIKHKLHREINENYGPINVEIQNTILLPPVEMSTEEQRALGYMPLRDDFEREFKNDAECLISNLAIANNQISYLFKEELDKSDDDQVDFDIKLALVKIYRECLIERQRHKRIAREYGLINNTSALMNTINKTSHSNNANCHGIVSEIHATIPPVTTVGRPKKNKPFHNYSKEKTDLNEKYKKFAQLITASEYETLVELTRKQRSLSERLKELNHYRANGINKLNDIDEYNRGLLDKERIKQEIKIQRKETKRMLCYSSPKRFTRFNSISSPVKSFSSSKRFKGETAKIEEDLCDNDDLITEDMDDENLSDDLFQVKSDDEKMEDCKSTEEDLSSAGAASSAGSAINEVNTNNIVRRLRRLNSRSSQNNSFSNKKKPNLTVKSSRESKNLRSKMRKISDEEDNTDETLNAQTFTDDDEEIFKIRSKKRKVLSSRSSSRSSSLSTSISNSSSDTKITKENFSFKNHSSRARRSNSERLCALPGYNLLSENEKKNSLSNREQICDDQPMLNDQLDLDDSLNQNLSKKKPNFSKSKKFVNSLKLSCPIYFQIPRVTRRRILRFLNDNGWINIA